MEEIRYKTASQIANYLESLGDTALFRGQIRQYASEESGVSLPSSFARLGCIPPLMFRWAHYSHAVLRALQGPGARPVALEYSQAVLQHYGWRSFFLDTSEGPSVAAWFAGHRYSSKVVLEMAEDCFEDPILLAHDTATYEELDGDGHLYVFPRAALEASNIGLVNLGATPVGDDARLRFVVQRAWLAGPLKDSLPGTCVLAHVSAPAEAFREYAATAGFTSVDTLFPSRSEDPILDLLLSVPWELIPAPGSGLDAYTRGLLLPEYNFKAQKIYPPTVAFFRPFWIAEDRGPEDGPFHKATFIRAPQGVLFGPSEPPVTSLPHLYDLLRERKSVVVEASGLVAFPEFSQDLTYGKGILLSLRGPNTIEVCGVSVDHPGRQVAGVGVHVGWFYEVQGDGTWARTSQDGECPCNNPARHEQYLVMAAQADYMLGEGDLVGRGDLDLVHKDLLGEDSKK